MERYKIYCTKEQTLKALELGAPIKHSHIFYEGFTSVYHNEDYSLEVYAIIPSAEEMVCWLEEQDGIKEITICKTGMWIWGEKHTIIEGGSRYTSRQESTLAAINAALKYLTQNK